MSEWDNESIVDDINSYVGFVYQITNIKTGKAYIGIKKFWKKIRRKPLKGQKRVRLDQLESDWKNYKTSNKEMQEGLKSHPEDYSKFILKLCKSVTEMKAYEAYLQLSFYFKGDWDLLMNEMINLRIRIRKGGK